MRLVLLTSILALQQLLIMHTTCAETNMAESVKTATEHRVPVIGIFSRKKFDLNPVPNSSAEDENYHYIAGSYVKWLESAGARSIAIHADASTEEVTEIFHQVNGILFPGGISISGTSTKAAETIWKLARESNEMGEPFPIWGTCLGFEWMLQFTSQKGESVIDWGYDAEDISYALNITEYGILNSTMFANEKVRSIARTKNVTFNEHIKGIHPDEFLADSEINELFRITSVNADKNGVMFVSSIESRDTELYPYYGVQWHPEKNSFEYGTLAGGGDTPVQKNINHSSEATYITYEMASLFVKEARRSTHTYTDYERFPLVYSYPMKQGQMIEQKYIISHLGEKNDKVSRSMIRGMHP